MTVPPCGKPDAFPFQYIHGTFQVISFLSVFCLFFECEFFRVSDISGSVIFNEPVELTECGVIRYPYIFSEESYLFDDSGIMNFQFDLSSIVTDGIYSVMLVAGDRSVARRMVVSSAAE